MTDRAAARRLPVLRLALAPLNRIQIISMRKMGKIQPKMKIVQEKYKDEPARPPGIPPVDPPVDSLIIDTHEISQVRVDSLMTGRIGRTGHVERIAFNY